MKNHSQILKEGYDKFTLPLGGKKVPCPYRENDTGSFQKVGPEFQGKSSPATIIKATKDLAKKKGFNLEKASVEEIREFMFKNKLGIDCSGFAYRTINHLTQIIFKKPLTALGFEHVGRTNVAKFTSDEMSIKVKGFKEIKPGDIIRLTLIRDPKIRHMIFVLENKNGIVTYAHSSEETDPHGVHLDYIKNGKLPEDLKAFMYNEKDGDSIRRLKILI
jgi:hypothetical protein